MKNTENAYGWPAKTFHWVIGLGMIGMVVFGLWMHEQPAPGKFAYYGIHKSTGMLILFLGILRLRWKLKNTTPKTLGHHNAQKHAARIVHILLYVMIIGIPLSGYVMSMAGGYPVSFYGLFNFPNLIGKNKEIGSIAHTIHGFVPIFVLGGLLALHIAGALYHHFVLKDETLKRMLPGKLIKNKK